MRQHSFGQTIFVPSSKCLLAIDPGGILRYISWRCNVTRLTDGYANTRTQHIVDTRIDQLDDPDERHVEFFPISDAGKSIWYRFRYLNTKDQPGPWTTTLAATILK